MSSATKAQLERSMKAANPWDRITFLVFQPQPRVVFWEPGCLTQRKFVWKQRHRSAPTGKRDSCQRQGGRQRQHGTAMHWLPCHGHQGLSAPAHWPRHEKQRTFIVSALQRCHCTWAGQRHQQNTWNWEQQKGEEWWPQFSNRKERFWVKWYHFKFCILLWTTG